MSKEEDIKVKYESRYDIIILPKLFIKSKHIRTRLAKVNEVVAERSWFGEMKMKSGLCCERAFILMPWMLNYLCENLYKQS